MALRRVLAAAARAGDWACEGRVPRVHVVLGIPLGFTPTWVVDRVTSGGDPSSEVPVRFPWLVVVGLVAVIPAVAAAGAWGAGGLRNRLRPPSPTRRD